MSNRFFLDPAISTIENDHAVLGGDEAHHFSRVLRGNVGDEIILFDGSGWSYRSKVVSVNKTTVTVQIIETAPDNIESPLRLTVATALPKGDRQRFLVEKLAELGVARFIPLHLERSVARANTTVTQRLKRYVVEAAKQCGRNVLMEMTNEMTLTTLNDFLTEQGKITKFLLHPLALGNVGQLTPQTILAGQLPKHIAVLIGPEGSFTDQEIETTLNFGFQPLHLGNRILRTETACIAAAAVFLTGSGM
jgi:16S rRNA (uracil1498-N3)-methyltransferase